MSPLSFIHINTTTTHAVPTTVTSTLTHRFLQEPVSNYNVHCLCLIHQGHSLSTHRRSEKSHQLDSHNHSMLLSLTNAISSSNILLLVWHFEHLTFHLLPLNIRQELLVSVSKALPSTPQPNPSLLYLLLQGQTLFLG